MKFSKLIIGLSAIFFLTGCQVNDIEITHEEFQERVNKMKSHRYSRATVKYEIDVSASGCYKSSNEKSSGEIQYNYSSLFETWTTTSSDSHAAYYCDLLYTIQGSTITDPISDNPNITMSVSYYYFPIELRITKKGRYISSGSAFTIDEYYSYIFDTYGYLTDVYCEYDNSAAGSSLTGNQKGTQTISISYK